MRPEEKALMELILSDCVMNREAKPSQYGTKKAEVSAPDKAFSIWVEKEREEIFFQPKLNALMISFRTAVGCAVCIESLLRDDFKIITF